MGSEVRPWTWTQTALGLVGVTAAVLLGTILRLQDPLSTWIIPAEDPYTHMAFLREHLRTGTLDPLYDGGSVYPPGMHGFLAALWVFTGSDLSFIFRFGPVAFGALGIIGVALLLWRNIGWVASVVGALGYAVAPELIFRTTMMAPTAVDLGVLPFYLYILVELAHGRLAWIVMAVPMTAFLVIMHPWVIWVLALTCILFVLISLALPSTVQRSGVASVEGYAAVLAVVFIGAAGAAIMGAGEEISIPDGLPVDLIAWFGILGVVVAFALVVRFAGRLDRGLSVWRARRLPLVARLLLSVAIGGALYGVTRSAAAGGFPEFVDLPKMIGWPILVLAAIALMAIPFLNDPMAQLAAGLALTTYPFVVFNVFDSPFWPHRTVAFLGIALTLLAGVAAFVLGVLLQRASAYVVSRMSRFGGHASHHAERLRTIGMAGFVPAALVAVSLSGTVVTGVPEPYDSWYRLYSECEQEALLEVAAVADQDPSAIVMMGSWQGKLIVAASTTNAQRVWYAPTFFTNPEERAGIIEWLSSEDTPLYVVVDQHLRREAGPDLNLSFLDSERWEVVVDGCFRQIPPQTYLVAYRLAVEG